MQARSHPVTVLVMLFAVTGLLMSLSALGVPEGLTVYTDKSVYSRGEGVTVFGFLTGEGGTPLPEKDLVVALFDPYDNEVQSVEARTDSQGKFTASLVVPQGSPEGYYRIDVSPTSPELTYLTVSVSVLVCDECAAALPGRGTVTVYSVTTLLSTFTERVVSTTTYTVLTTLATPVTQTTTVTSLTTLTLATGGTVTITKTEERLTTATVTRESTVRRTETVTLTVLTGTVQTVTSTETRLLTVTRTLTAPGEAGSDLWASIDPISVVASVSIAAVAVLALAAWMSGRPSRPAP